MAGHGRQNLNRRLGNNELALAMELKTEGYRTSIIANALGVQPGTLSTAIKTAKKRGLKKCKAKQT